MNQDILLSKVVPNPTETTWAQAYTTLNVYITLSIERLEGKHPVTTYGKDLLEKLQREFFALDDKSLENIKNAVGNVSKNIEKNYKYSIIVGAIVGDILYIVIASEGQVIIKRGEKVGIIAAGIENELHGFSGKLKHNDIILLETGDFGKKISIPELTSQLSSDDVSQIAENITPIIHGDSKGTEGAIILQFKNIVDEKVEEKEPTTSALPEEFKSNDSKNENEEIDNEYLEENLWTKPRSENTNIENLDSDNYEDSDTTNPKKFPYIALPNFNFLTKKLIIIVIIILLILSLAGGIYYQNKKSNDSKAAQEFSKIYDPIKSKFDEAVKLENLNKTLALEGFNQTIKLVSEALSKYDKSSSEYKKLSDLKGQIESKISEIGGGESAKNVKEFVKINSEIKSITAITTKGGTLIVLDSTGKKVATIKDTGAVGKIYDLDSSAKFISGDDKYIYIMGSKVTSIDRGNGNVKEVIKKISGTSFDIFGSNLYTLENGDILKYKAPAYEGVSYFTDKPSFKSAPSDMAISGPIRVLESDGSIESFTKGVKDDFEVSGLAAPIGEGAKIYADSDLDNVYVMDVKNQRVVVFSDSGEFITQYEGSFIKDANSFAIDEKNGIGYVLSRDIVYSFDL